MEVRIQTRATCKSVKRKWRPVEEDLVGWVERILEYVRRFEIV